MSSQTDKPFEALEIPRRELPPDLTKRYRVYKDPGDFMLVEAASAAEALKASGLPKAHRVQRDALFLHNVIKLEAMTQPEEAPPPAAAADAAPATEAAAPSEPPPA